MKKIIFFDCFGVIVNEVAVSYFRKYFDEKTYLSLKEGIFTKVDIGQYSEDKGYQEIAKLQNKNYLDIKKEWYDSIKLNEEVINLIKKLNQNYGVYLLSNAASSFVRNIFDKFDLNNLFKKMYISSEIKHIKPNKDYFEYVLNDLNLSPFDCIMIDDTSKNIDTCKNMNLNGIVFKDVKQLIDELKKYDIKGI